MQLLSQKKLLPEQQQTLGHHTQGQRKCHQLVHFQKPIQPARSVFPNEWQCRIYMLINNNASHTYINIYTHTCILVVVVVKKDMSAKELLRAWLLIE